MANPLDLIAFARRAWETTNQPIKERATVLPLGQYEDGSVGLAWPGMLADPVQRGYQAANSPIPAINDDEAWREKSAAMFDVTSLAPMGAGLAGGIVDNAVGSAGGNLAKGQGIRAYHGTATQEPISSFRSGMKGDSPHMEHDVPAIFFSTNPRVADEYAASTGKELADRLSQEWRAAGKSEDEIAQLFDQRSEADKNAAWKGYVDNALSGLPPNVARVLRPSAERYQIDVDSIAKEFGPDVAETMRRNLDLARSTSDYYPDYSAVYPVDVGGNLKEVDAKIFGGQFNAIIYDNLLKEAKEQGFDGLRLRNVQDSPYGTELESDVLAMFNPGHVRSATTGDLLYSNAPTGSIPGLAAQTQDQDGNPALLEYLRQIGLY